ncbi:MAG: hypothetical protein WA138_09265 [Parvibaculum sp.]
MLSTLALAPLPLGCFLLGTTALLILPTFCFATLHALTGDLRLLRLILLNTIRLGPLPLRLGLRPKLFCPPLLNTLLPVNVSLFLARRILASIILILILILLRLRPLSSVSLSREGRRCGNTH